jgi:phosphatidylserine/phosphatidylglycerophosphate/cardiolipin synthase-like enzyme
VKVRIIVDAGMYKTYPETVDWLGMQPNIYVVKYDVKALTGGIQHAKFFIVDGEQVFFGSQNFDWRALSHVHEIGVRFTLPKEKSYNGRLFKEKIYYEQLFDADYCAITRPEKMGQFLVAARTI